MSQGKQTQQEQSDEQNEIEFEIELPNEMWDYFERIGNGDISEGVKTAYKYYVKHYDKAGTPLLAAK